MLKISLFIFLVLHLNLYSQPGRAIDSLKNKVHETTGKEQLNLFFQLAGLYKNSSLDSSFHYSKKALDLSNKLKDSSSQARALLLLSFYNFLEYKMAKSSEHSSQALKIYRRLGDSVGVAKSYLQKGLIKWRQGEFDVGLQIYLSACNLYKKSNNREGIATSLNYIGLIYWKKGDYLQAVKNLVTSLEIKNEIGNKYEIGITLNNLGKIYNELYEYKKSIGYSELALALSDSVGNKYLLSRALSNLGLSYAGLKEYKKALVYLKNATELKLAMNDKIGMGFAYEDIGNIYKEMGSSKKAFEYYRKSLAVREETNDKYGIASILIAIAKIQVDSNDYKSSYESINRGEKIAKDIGANYLLKECYKLLSLYYFNKSAFHKAYLYLTKYSTLRDSLFNKINIKKIAEMDAKYKVDKIEKEISVLKQQKKIWDLELERQKSWRIFLFFASIILLLFAGTVYSRSHIKKKAYSLLSNKNEELTITNKKLYDSELALKELNATKDKFFSIIAHDLKNPFNSIMGFYNLIIKEYKDLTDEEKLEYITAMGNSINNSYLLLENLLQWSRSQMGAIAIEKQKLEINSVCTSVISSTLTQAKNKKITITKGCSNILFVYADRFMVETVIRNLITNAIKFTNEGGQITISAKLKEGAFVEFCVEDNGIGLSKETQEKLFNITENQSTLGTSNESGTGLGLIICKEFVEKNGGQLWVESEIGKGSKFIFTLPTT